MAFAVLKGVKKLQVLLGGAVATSECPITVNYRDITTTNKMGQADSTDSITTGNTAVDVVAAPPAGVRRELEGFSLYNDDTTSVTVTVRVYVSSSTTRVIFYGTLLTNESLLFDESRGWYCLNANGEQKLSSQTDVGNASSQASSMAALTPASVSSQASSIAALTPASVSSQASSIAALTPASVSSQASSIAAVNPHTVSSILSNLSTQSLTSTTFSTVSSTVSRVKSSFTW